MLTARTIRMFHIWLTKNHISSENMLPRLFQRDCLSSEGLGPKGSTVPARPWKFQRNS